MYDFYELAQNDIQKIFFFNSGRNFCLGERGKKYTPKSKIINISGLFYRLAEISGPKYFGFKNFQYFPKSTPNIING